MAFDRDALRRQLRIHAKRLQAGGVALFVLASSVWIGKQSRAHLTPLARQLSDLHATNDKLTEWRRAFRSPDSAEQALIRADSTALRSLAVPAGTRMQVAQLVARQADDAGLSRVGLSFVTAPDSTVVPQRGQVGEVPIAIAKYLVSVDCTGSFAAALKFVSHLPPSITMTRFGVIAEPAGAKYHVVLSVYEVPNGSR